MKLSKVSSIDADIVLCWFGCGKYDESQWMQHETWCNMQPSTIMMMIVPLLETDQFFEKKAILLITVFYRNIRASFYLSDQPWHTMLQLLPISYHAHKEKDTQSILHNNKLNLFQSIRYIVEGDE